jgi:hypothetical protein
MVSKEKFVDIMKYLEDTNSAMYLIDQANNFLKRDFYDSAMLMDFHLQDYVLELLQDSLGDTNDYISWWVYDTDFGKEDANLYMEDEVTVCLDTSGKLYEYLVLTKGE